MELCRHARSGNFISCSSYFVLVPKEEPYNCEQVTFFVKLWKIELSEHCDNRGKRHPLAFVIAAFVLYIGRSPKAFQHSPIYAQSRRLVAQTDLNPQSKINFPCAFAAFLDGLNGSVLNELIEHCFGVRL